LKIRSEFLDFLYYYYEIILTVVDGSAC
jgi:hypothetical protein